MPSELELYRLYKAQNPDKYFQKYGNKTPEELAGLVQPVEEVKPEQGGNIETNGTVPEQPRAKKARGKQASRANEAEAHHPV